MDRGRYRESSVDFRRPSDLTTLVENEAAWLSSPLNKWNDGRSECLPYVLSKSMPVGEVYSDDRSFISEEDEDILVCTTVTSYETMSNFYRPVQPRLLPPKPA
jgi:hypothetical protein